MEIVGSKVFKGGIMIKKLKDYSDADKIKLFDKIYRDTRDEWHDSRKEEDRDEHYFWEGIMETVLGPDIWEK